MRQNTLKIECLPQIWRSRMFRVVWFCGDDIWRATALPHHYYHQHGFSLPRIQTTDNRIYVVLYLLVFVCYSDILFWGRKRGWWLESSRRKINNCAQGTSMRQQRRQCVAKNLIVGISISINWAAATQSTSRISYSKQTHPTHPPKCGGWRASHWRQSAPDKPVGVGCVRAGMAPPKNVCGRIVFFASLRTCVCMWGRDLMRGLRVDWAFRRLCDMEVCFYGLDIDDHIYVRWPFIFG